MSIMDLWISFYEWYKLSQKEAIQMISSKESVINKHKWKALDVLDHVVIDANGLIIWEIVGSYVIDVNDLV
jgi:hypothetical protein